jgi:hypothetical protein
MCSRRFNEEAFEKHSNICQKVFMTKRKEFKSDKQRATEDAPKKGPAQVASKKPSASAQSKAEKAAKWKKQSEAFRAVIIAARKGESAP